MKDETTIEVDTTPLTDWSAIIPADLRQRVKDSAAEIRTLMDESPRIQRAMEVAAEIEHLNGRARLDMVRMGSPDSDISELISELTGFEELFCALDDLREMLNPERVTTPIFNAYMAEVKKLQNPGSGT